jgi:leucyl aminopeptidase
VRRPPLRPGDIVTSLSGKTIEVLNTDAEGPLILVDAIEYARRLGVTHMVDAATLTGAIVVALGHVHVGAFTNDEEMLGRVLASARAQGENLWHMPLDDDYKDYRDALRRPAKHWGTLGRRRHRGVLSQGVDRGTPWVHLDIAWHGVARRDQAVLAKGPTGSACARLSTWR